MVTLRKNIIEYFENTVKISRLKPQLYFKEKVKSTVMREKKSKCKAYSYFFKKKTQQLLYYSLCKMPCVDELVKQIYQPSCDITYILFIYTCIMLLMQLQFSSLQAPV